MRHLRRTGWWHSVAIGLIPVAVAIALPPSPAAGRSSSHLPSTRPTTHPSTGVVVNPSRPVSAAPARPKPAATTWLPFDLPTSAALRSSSKLAFAHYFTPFPVSIDNKAADADYYTRNYLAPTGESGKHAAYGGLLRDRPLAGPPRTGDWADQNFQDEVRQAISAGLDGFAVDLLSLTSYNYDRVVALMKAAHEVDPAFKIMLQPDMTTLSAQIPEALAAGVSRLAASPAAFHLPDGRLVVSPFKAENKTAAWWADWLALMKADHGITVAFVPTLLDWQRYAASFTSISYGFSHWGLSNPAANVDAAKHAALAHSMGKLWMAPVHVQDARPSGGIFDEAGNTESLRLSWDSVIDGGADWVNLPTWNDYSEGTDVAPSAHHGRSYLDISSYYLTWWKTGTAPPIERDAIYLTHRDQPVAASPVYPETKLMTLRPGGTAARDTVEALVFLTAPATVTVHVGAATYTWDAPAGVAARTFPLGVGRVSASAARAGRTTATVTSPFTVTSTPYVQDLQYDAVGSLRESDGS